MPRSYRHIKEYEKEILELKSQGLTEREIGNQLGFSKKQINNFITRYNANQRKIEAGIIIKPKGRPRKDGNSLPPSIQQLRRQGDGSIVSRQGEAQQTVPLSYYPCVCHSVTQ